MGENRVLHKDEMRTRRYGNEDGAARTIFACKSHNHSPFTGSLHQ